VTGRVTSDACLKIDECDSKAACDGSLQRLSTQLTPAAGTNISMESKPSEHFLNVITNRTLALAELNNVDLLSSDAFLQAQCADGYEGRLCHTCSAGWARSGKADCISCDWPTWANELGVVAVTLLLLTAFAFMVRHATLPR
jgi:hypothetical protein